jgi:hypothetical protein
VYWQYIEGIITVNEHFVPRMAWQMAISEGGVIKAGFLTCVEIGSASCSGSMRGWRYIEWQYIDGTLYYINTSFYHKFFSSQTSLKKRLIYTIIPWRSGLIRIDH